MVEKLIWHTEKRKIKDLVPTEGNPRQLTTKQAEDLQKSLKRFNIDRWETYTGKKSKKINK